MKRLQWILALAVAATVLLAGAPAFAETFTLAVIPDVQQETGDSRLRDRLQWLADHAAELNLKMVLQVGDMMNFNDPAQYAHQSEAFEVLDAAGIPYATALGNHDTAAVKVDGGGAAPGNVNLNLRDTARYNAYFPTNRFTALRGTFEPGKIDNAYHVFSGGGAEWLVVNLELWARTNAVEWARNVVARHPEHPVVFLTHAHLNADATIQRNNGGYGDSTPQQVFDRAIRPFKNSRFVFSGHTGSHGRRVDVGEHGNAIHQFLQCYHDGRDNPVRLVEIDLEAGTVATRVFCPTAGADKADGSTGVFNLQDGREP